MLKIRATSRFKKDLKVVQKHSVKKKSLEILDKIIIPQLQRLQLLDRNYRDHELVNQKPKKRECHVLPDLLLIYRTTDENLILYRLGTHSDLF